jgi:hypothetical protein
VSRNCAPRLGSASLTSTTYVSLSATLRLGYTTARHEAHRRPRRVTSCASCGHCTRRYRYLPGSASFRPRHSTVYTDASSNSRALPPLMLHTCPRPLACPRTLPFPSACRQLTTPTNPTLRRVIAHPERCSGMAPSRHLPPPPADPRPSPLWTPFRAPSPYASTSPPAPPAAAQICAVPSSRGARASRVHPALSHVPGASLTITFAAEEVRELYLPRSIVPAYPLAIGILRSFCLPIPPLLPLPYERYLLHMHVLRRPGGLA